MRLAKHYSYRPASPWAVRVTPFTFIQRMCQISWKKVVKKTEKKQNSKCSYLYFPFPIYSFNVGLYDVKSREYLILMLIFIYIVELCPYLRGSCSIISKKNLPEKNLSCFTGIIVIFISSIFSNPCAAWCDGRENIWNWKRGKPDWRKSCRTNFTGDRQHRQACMMYSVQGREQTAGKKFIFSPFGWTFKLPFKVLFWFFLKKYRNVEHLILPH